MRIFSATISTLACSPIPSSSPSSSPSSALVIAFPVAFALTRLPRTWRGIVFACVLLPLWISVLVRTFSWMLLLERNGPINRFIVASGLSDQPLSLLFNHTAVLIGMVHVLLPYAVLPIYAALVRIDPALLRASEGLGASAVTTFRRVLFPLSLSGVATAATFTFLLALGFFVTPALLGGASSLTLSMLIDGFVSERLDWPLAAAASVLLLAAALVVVAVAGALRPGRRASRGCIDERRRAAEARATARCPGGQRSGASRKGGGRSMTGRLALNSFVALAAAFLVLPILAIVPAAFSAQSFIRLPPDAWSLRWWGAFFNDVSWRRDAAREPQGRRASRRSFRSSPERPRRSASRGAAPRARSAADRPVPGPGGDAGDRARRRALQHGSRHGSRRHHDRTGRSPTRCSPCPSSC